MFAPSSRWLVLLLLDAALAIPAAAPVAVRKNVVVARQATPASPNPTAAWVTVDDSGHAKTVTPVLTTISGTPTVISAAPHDATATVFTYNNFDGAVTSTGPAEPQATNSEGAGAFAVCHNTDGNYKPFCSPTNNTTIYPGGIHYITWDPLFFKTSGSNTTVKIMGFYNVNETDQAFSSGNMAAAWGFYQWSVDKDLLTTKGASDVNITLRIAALPIGAAAAVWVTGPTVRVTYPPGRFDHKTEPPSGPALYIGLPTVLGVIILLLCGTCYWNRHKRRIGLGNIMSRRRHGYGIGKSRRQRTKATKEQAIHLMDRQEVGGGIGGAVGEGRPRRDSDALGSLAGSPTEDRHFDDFIPRAGGGAHDGNCREGNAFRDELARQAKERP
ncbi:hypothetical protein B0T26DRAFT_632653 [Lasiosphaeria miniovina]|uniref:Uncharacterized protein n=1 Tax=Lasiosphaeria miniovina TaxID=1954250 RepID=A0AA40BIV2_9PEZI|nr:uncharacterized protein B0T26DRAFT_632653 [Lasiosphaeria miniovina]KAK0735030.1 hypothetical protein B0T26DRAFT_632653 [Lasiosphaeria miniovina]